MATRIWVHAYGPFEYLGEDPSVGCTSNPGVKSVSLIDSGLTVLVYKKKKREIIFHRQIVVAVRSLLFFSYKKECTVE